MLTDSAFSRFLLAFVCFQACFWAIPAPNHAETTSEPLRVLMQTSLGNITLELNTDKAPISCKNFMTYVDSGFYNGTIFHRVISSFMIQGGGFTTPLKKKAPRPPIKNEWRNGLKNKRGTVAMARLGGRADSATSQFFINVKDNPVLDQPRDGAGYAVFAKVVDGMEVVDRIKKVPTTTKGRMGDVPVKPVLIEKVSRIVQAAGGEKAVSKSEERGMSAVKLVKGLSWHPAYITQLGCIQAGLKHLKMDVDDAWLFGATGYAFVINIHDELCPSGPTAWNTHRVEQLGKNLGYTLDSIIAMKQQPGFAQQQKLAFAKVKTAIDNGLPCYGWELDVPEFYVINGYDDTGYHFINFDGSQKGPKPWQTLGDTEIQVLNVSVIKPHKTEKPITDRIVVKQAIEFALDHATNSEKYLFQPSYHTGLDAFDTWIAWFGKAKWDESVLMGLAYNAACWSECRTHAVEFLKQAKARINDKALAPLFDDAITHYQKVADNMKVLSDRYPFLDRKPEHATDTSRRDKALTALKAARQAEEKALQSLRQLAEKL